MPGGRITQHRKRSPYQSFFLIQRPLFLYFPYSVFSLLSRIFTGFLSLPICDLCFRFRLIFQRSFLFHFPVVDFLFSGRCSFQRLFLVVKIPLRNLFLRIPKICSDLMLSKVSFELLLYGSLSQVSSFRKSLILRTSSFSLFSIFYRRFLVSFYENGLFS